MRLLCWGIYANMIKKLKYISLQLHIWLGAISGLIVFIVCITGAIWAIGINNWLGTNDEPKIEQAKDATILKPSVFIEKATATLDTIPISNIYYEQELAVKVSAYTDNGNISFKYNPYSGDLISTRNFDYDNYELSFWDYMRWGHRALWLPWDVGRVIVNYGTLVFAITLITGVIIWIPKSKKALKKSIVFSWNKKTRLRRKMLDLHVILGLYICFFLLVICFTGMVWGIEWWSKSTYKLTTGNDLPAWAKVQSDTINQPQECPSILSFVDSVFTESIKTSEVKAISFSFPKEEDKAGVLGVRKSYDNKVLYNFDALSFDRYTLKEIPQDAYYAGKYADKSFGEKLRRQNYDLHVGRVWGTVGEILMFFAALFGASLPITGYYLMFKGKKKKKKKHSDY